MIDGMPQRPVSDRAKDSSAIVLTDLATSRE
jgi:hypothetical protein